MSVARTVRNGAMCLSVVVAVMAVGASSALALSPWWHLSVRPSPTALQPGSSENEVQSIEAHLVDFFGTPAAVFEVRIRGVEVGVFATEPLAASAKVPAASAANLQSALEGSGAYGTGNVEVTGGPAGTSVLLVKSVGADSGVPVAPIEVVEEIGGASAQVVTPGKADGQILVTAANLGDANATGAHSPIVIADTLPTGFRPVAIKGIEDTENSIASPVVPECSIASLTCTFHHGVGTYAEDEVLISVVLEAGAKSGAVDRASVTGGEAPPANADAAITIGGQTGFGAQAYELEPEEEGGARDEQAGSHPFQLTTTIMLNRSSENATTGLAKDLHFKLPPV